MPSDNVNPPMFALSSGYSTTRLLTNEHPVIEEPPGAAFKTVLSLPEGEGRQGEGGLRTQGYFKRSLPDKPLITVITVVYNGAEHLEETIESVIHQTYDNVEYIIIDGGSTDGTLDILRKYAHAIDYWVSEKDEGIYDAMNKGGGLALGKGINFLNSGDFFKGQVLRDYERFPVFLPVKYRDFTGKIKTMSLSKCYKLGMPYSHQGIIFNNEKKSYTLKYKISSDYDFFLRHQYNSIKIEEKVSGYVFYDNYGISSRNRKKRDSETSEIIYSYFGVFFQMVFFIQCGLKNMLRLLCEKK